MGPKVKERLLRKAVKKFKLKIPVHVDICMLPCSVGGDNMITNAIYTTPGPKQNYHRIQLNKNSPASYWAYGDMSNTILHELGHAKQFELGIFKGAEAFAGDENYDHNAYLKDPLEVAAWRFADRHIGDFKRLCGHTRTSWGHRQYDRTIIIDPKG